mgnify:CR=1 FL=1
MSNTTNVGNFSVQSFTSPGPIPEGDLITDYLINYLTLVPNAGFEISANDFSAINPLPTYVSSVVFFQSTQDSKNVICEVQLTSGTVMPAGGIDIGLCISGFSNTANYSISGSFDYVRSNNVVPATLGTAYNLSGHFEANENVFTQSVAATSGYYFPQQPTISLSVGDINNYNSSFSNVLDISGNIINTVFTVDYTFPALNITGDAWEIDASAEEIYIPVIEITNYDVITSSFSEQGGFRYYTIYGSEGANWSLTAVGTNGINDILTLDQPPFTNALTGTLGSSGSQEITINIPVSTTGPQSFDLTIAGDLQSPFAQNTTVTLRQLSDVTVTYSTISSLGYLTTPGDYTITGFSYVAFSGSNRPSTPINWVIDSNNPATVLIPKVDINSSYEDYIQNNDSGDIEFIASGTGFTHAIFPLVGDPLNLPSIVGWNFINQTSYSPSIEVTAIDYVLNTITFNTSISVLVGQRERIGNNKSNNVEFGLNISRLGDGVAVVGEPSINNFGFANNNFILSVDNLVEEVSLPSVVTVGVSNETGATADSGGETITDGNGSISSKGTQWSSLADFSVIDGTTTDGTGTADYVSNITGLTSGNTYYVRAYVINEAGIAYGQVIQFQASPPCTISGLTITTTDPNNAGGNNGTATVGYNNSIGNVSYTLNGGSSVAVTSSPFTINNLLGNTTYNIIVSDDVSPACASTGTFTLGQSTFVFDADWILIELNFTAPGRDLDIRSRIVTPDVGQDTQPEYLGWSVQPRWPIGTTNQTSYSIWGGDNTGQGVESVLHNVNNIQNNFPNDNNLVIDARGFWFGDATTNPVSVVVTMWTGGAPVSGGFTWTNPTATDSLVIQSTGTVISQSGQNASNPGQRIATITYNVNTGVGLINNNDTTTPEVL